MAANGKYPPHLLLLLIRLTAAFKGHKTDFSGLRKLALHVMDDLKLQDGAEGFFEEQYLDKKYKDSYSNLRSLKAVSAKEDKIESLLKYNGYASFEHFSTKAEAVFDLLKQYKIYDISSLESDDKHRFLQNVSVKNRENVSVESDLKGTDASRIVLSFHLYPDDEEEGDLATHTLWLQFCRHSGHMEGRLLADKFPILYISIALDIFLQLPRGRVRRPRPLLSALQEPIKPKPAMRQYQVSSSSFISERLYGIVWKKAFLAALFVLVLLLIFYAVFTRSSGDKPSRRDIEAGILKREQYMEALVRQSDALNLGEATHIEGQDPITKASLIFDSTQAYYRNYYGFTNGYRVVEYKKNIEQLLEKDIDKLTPWNNFGFDQPNISGQQKMPDLSDTTFLPFDISFGLSETTPPGARVLKLRRDRPDRYILRVRYQQPLRYLAIRYSLNNTTEWYKIRTLKWVGFAPEEELVFQKKGDAWEYVGLAL